MVPSLLHPIHAELKKKKRLSQDNVSRINAYSARLPLGRWRPGNEESKIQSLGRWMFVPDERPVRISAVWIFRRWWVVVLSEGFLRNALRPACRSAAAASGSASAA